MKTLNDFIVWSAQESIADTKCGETENCPESWLVWSIGTKNEFDQEFFSLKLKNDRPPSGHPYIHHSKHSASAMCVLFNLILFFFSESNGTVFENCFGFIQYIRFLQDDDNQTPTELTVIKLKNEDKPNYTSIAQTKLILMDAYYYDLEVQLLTNSCGRGDGGFSDFKVYRG